MKKILFIAGSLLAVHTVNAAYLYWQITADTLTEASEATAWAEAAGLTLNAARIYDSEGTAQTLYFGGASTASAVAGVTQDGMPGAFAIDVGDYTGSASYYVELGNWNSASQTPFQAIAIGTTQTVDQLYDSGFISTSVLSVPTTVWHGGPYTAVPEPTSAVLMLFGAAFLGLKRKNRSIA